MTITGLGANGLSGYINPYGDGADGSMSITSNVTDSGVYHTTDYTIQDTYSVTIAQGKPLVIFAQNKITINGTIYGFGQGGAGGAGGSGNGLSAQDGGNGESMMAGEFTGGDGGDGGDGDTSDASDPGTGGTGGSSTYTTRQHNQIQTEFTYGDAWSAAFDGTITAGHGGGGGGSSADSNYNNDDFTAGGDGGNGGGCVILIAPTIEVNGTIDLGGAHGNDGEDGTSTMYGGGGGGGGSGGLLITMCDGYITNSASINLAGGNGGIGGSSGVSGASGDDGLPGDTGNHIKIR